MTSRIENRDGVLVALADRIEARLRAAPRQACFAEAERGRVDALTPSLLARAFAGKLVPQDPSDEPASILPERIEMQRKNTDESRARKRL